MSDEACSIDPTRRHSGINRAHAPEGHVERRVPQTNEDGEVAIDPWWGVIQPASLHPQIVTIGELELIEHLGHGGAAIDTRRPDYVEASDTIPGARAIHWEKITDHLELFEDGVTVLFCNGPQCAATPRAVELLLASGAKPERIAYYRGGLHDWISLGLPVEPPQN
jgi:rhodanese-related sulfurtransferase